VRELQKGLWHWEAPHPEWTPGEDWDHQMVSSYAIDDGDRLLLFDPLAVPSEIEELAAERETAIVLTCPWHERDARSLVERLGAPIFLPPPEDFNDDVEWLRGDLERLEKEGRVFRAGDRLPVGVEAFPGKKPCDLVLWIESRRALVAGDTLLDRGRGLELPVDWLSEGVTREQVIGELRPLLELPVELVLPTHGPPTDRAALEHALS
jgi:glyoxylase-like metal-dependent hydrolase (beta-lactamase superfamily II)